MKSSFVAVNEFMRPLTLSLIFEKNSKVKFWYFFLGSFWDRPRSFEDRCGSLWIVVDRCGSLWVVPGFSNYGNRFNIAGKTTSSHQHALICLQNSTRRRSWICDFCSRASEDLIRETYSYRCEECDFDLCFDCVQPRQHPAHYHALEVAEKAYNISYSWNCGICGCPNKPDEM